ncbi:MAG: DNA polymerase III subunit delta' [Patescibacteria group bacterium]
MNWEIIGHGHIINYLEHAIVNDRLAHAFLFYGPKQLGKKKLAMQFAKILLCCQNKFDSLEKINPIDLNQKFPCGSCEHCVEFDKGTHPDFYALEKNKQEKNISVDQIRELRSQLSNKSFFKSYKIVIIENAESMSLAASNSLLKTIEEPRGKTVIILTAESLSALPKTILSRTQKIKFLPVSTKEIYDYLIRHKKIEHKEASDIANISQGRPGRSIIFASSQHLWKIYNDNINTFFKLISATDYQKIGFVENLLEKQKKIIDKNNIIFPMLNLWQTLFRDILLLKNDLSVKIVNSKVRTELETLEPYFTIIKLYQIDKILEQTKKYLKQNVNPRLVLENLVLNF